MIKLGSFDSQVSGRTIDAYKNSVRKTTRVGVDEISGGSDKLTFKKHIPSSHQSMTVIDVQNGLRDIGFYTGGEASGICGYRTISAIRLFQEYVRSVEKIECIPDGLLGPTTQGHLMRWIQDGHRMTWQTAIDKWNAGDTAGTEYQDWLDLCVKTKAKYQLNPSRMLQLVEDYSKDTDTAKVANWDFDPRHMHMIGIRRNEIKGKFDDVILFLIKGLVFKFQGSTEPGESSHRRGLPFLVQGQHDYHFGWHRRQYLALRPAHLNNGVLIVRSKNNKELDAQDLKNGLEVNATINIHWGGKGIKFNINKWSAGCQVINGSGYINPEDELIDCSSFVATNNRTIGRGKTRGAYNVLVDLATALSIDMDTSIIKYMLLNESDLDLSPNLKVKLSSDRERVGQFINRL